MSVVDHYEPSVTAHEVGEGDHNVGGSNDRVSKRRRDINAGVEGSFTIERVNALPEGTRDSTLDGPQCRRSRGADPVGQGGHAFAIQPDTSGRNASQRGGS